MLTVEIKPGLKVARTQSNSSGINKMLLYTECGQSSCVYHAWILTIKSDVNRKIRVEKGTECKKKKILNLRSQLEWCSSREKGNWRNCISFVHFFLFRNGSGFAMLDIFHITRQICTTRLGFVQNHSVSNSSSIPSNPIGSVD